VSHGQGKQTLTTWLAEHLCSALTTVSQGQAPAATLTVDAMSLTTHTLCAHFPGSATPQLHPPHSSFTAATASV